MKKEIRLFDKIRFCLGMVAALGVVSRGGAGPWPDIHGRSDLAKAIAGKLGIRTSERCLCGRSG